MQPGHAGLAREEVRFALGALHGERLDPQKRLEQRVEVLQIPVRIPCARARAVGPRAPPAEAAATGLSAKRFDTAWDGDSPSTCGWSVARCTEAGLKLVLRHYAPILTHRRFHLRRFMSEVLGYVLRKAPLNMTNDCIAAVVDILGPQVAAVGCSVTDKVRVCAL